MSPEMIVNSPLATKFVHDYDVLFTSGMVLPASLDLEAGDTIDFNLDTILIHLAPKPSQNNPDVTLPAEDITIFVKHVLSIQHRTREVLGLTPEQNHEWRKTLSELTVQ